MTVHNDGIPGAGRTEAGQTTAGSTIDGEGFSAEGRSSAESRTVNDNRNAQRFVREYGDKVLFNHSTQDWMLWDGKRWVEDVRGLVREYGKAVLEMIEAEANASGIREHISRALRSNSWRGLADMLRAAQSIPSIAVTVSELDADPLKLNLQNGTLDLRTLTLTPHVQSDRITKICRASFDLDAEAPHWHAYITAFSNHDPEQHGFLRRAIGYTLTAEGTEKCLFILHGPSNTGKSVIMNTLHYLLNDYSADVPFDTFMSHNANMDRPRPELVRLRGTRFVSSSEGEDNMRLAESIIKRMTGRDPVTCRDLFKPPITFIPSFKLWFASNHLPVVRGVDDAIWNRMRRIPCTNVIPPERQDSRLEGKLFNEIDGILNWCLLGLTEYRKLGLVQSQSVIAATEEYRRDSDIMQEFLDDTCERSDSLMIEKRRLFRAFVEWSQERNYKVPTEKGFTRMMRDKGLTEARTKTARYWSGIGILDPEGFRAALPPMLDEDPF